MDGNPDQIKGSTFRRDVSKNQEAKMRQPAAGLLPILFLCFLTLFPSCNGADRLWEYCGTDKNITRPTSAIVGHVLKDLVATASSGGFATVVFYGGGGGGETVYGLAQCRGDVSVADCSACLSDAAAQLPELCRGRADARIWFDYCFLRYGTTDFRGQLDTGLGLFYINTENVTQNTEELERFEAELGKTLRKVQSQAVKTAASKGLGKEQTRFTPFLTIYALGQCTLDLPALGCAQCISTAVANIPSFCRYRKGCRALYSSCYVRYEIYPFFFPLIASSAQTVAAGRYTTRVVDHP